MGIIKQQAMQRSFSVWVIILISLVFFHTRGLITHDEGWVLNAAMRILDGQVPYRDFYFLYTPGSIFSTALFFKIFGQSILSARILALIFSSASTFFIYKIMIRIHKSKFISFACVLLFLFWGPYQINFVWMVMLSITSGLATIYFLTKSDKSANYMYLAGICAGLTSLFKQNFGAAIIIVAVLAFIFDSKLLQKTKILNFIFGFTFVTGLFIIYLLANDTYSIFINQMYYLLFQKIFLEGMLSSPFIYPDPIYKQIVKLAFYSFPLVISMFSIHILWSNNKKQIFLASFPLFYYLLSIRPTTDIIHLSPLIAILGINFVLIYKFSKNFVVKNLTIASLGLFICLGAYIVIFRGYYRWEAQILSHNIFYKDPRVNIFVDEKSNYVLSKVLPELKKSDSRNIFVYHFAPMFYFISDKKNLTYYDDLQPKLLTATEQEKIISSLKRGRVDTVLTNSNLKAENTKLTEYILNNYQKTKAVQEFEIYQLK